MPHALLSVHNKTGLVSFAKNLQQLGWQLLASGSTAKALQKANLPVTLVADYTKTPELFGGRVKTLHPAIHGGLLAKDTADDQNSLTAQGWHKIDLVAVNLYPFVETIQQADSTLADAIEQIDIGGVALIRAAAKNYQSVNVVTEPSDYTHLLEQLRQGGTSLVLRKQLAVKAFKLTSQYDTAIHQYLAEEVETSKRQEETVKQTVSSIQLTLYPQEEALPYGENPHQKEAKFYSFHPGTKPLGATLLQAGKPLSYNNLLDLDTAWRTVINFDEPTVCIVKHLSPCGVASATQLAAAFKAAFDCDPVSAFGGIIASNRLFDEATVCAMDKLFVECMIAPDFSPEALAQLAKRPRCRLLKVPFTQNGGTESEFRSIQGGLLKQSRDLGDPAGTAWTVVTDHQPSAQERQALTFAWQVSQHVKSNAIVLTQGQATVGIGGGQTNRLDALHTAAKRAGNNASGAALASDAFFPFSDGVETAAQYGIKTIIQPGGSIRDKAVIEAANRLGISMVFTGIRHFRH